MCYSFPSMADDPLRVNALALADEFDRRAAEVRREAEEKAQQYEAQAAQLRSAVGVRDEGLTSTRINSTVTPMDVNTQSEAVRRGAGRATRKHPAQRRLYERGQTISGLAKKLGEGRPRVSAWFADGDANRPIPRRYAEALKAEYGIPLSNWARIAD